MAVKKNNAGLSLIELYRANIADPKTVETIRFWASNELKKIESSFHSVEDFLRTIQTAQETESGGEQGEKGDKGDQGAPGMNGVDGDDGVDGMDGDVGDLLADGEIRTDKTWSSAQINTAVSAKQDPHDYMAWKPDNNNQHVYSKWSVVSSSGWLSIANKGTNDYPFPVQVGVEADMYVASPSWTSTPTHTGHVRSGYTITLLEPVEITSVEVWAPEVLAATHFTLVMVKNPAESFAVTRRIPLLAAQLTAGAWSSIPVEKIFGAPGQQYLFYLESQNYSATTSVSGQYKFYSEQPQESSGGAPPGVGYFTYDYWLRTLRLNETDNLAATPALSGAVVGSTITLTLSATVFVSFIVTSALVDQGTYKEWGVQLIDANGAFAFDDVCTLAITIPTASSTKYVALTTHWSTVPRWGTFAAFLEHDGVDQVPTSTTGYGINLTTRQLEQSGDWDLIPLGGAAAGMEGHVIALNDVPLTARANLNFHSGHFLVTDDSGTNSSDVELSTSAIANLALGASSSQPGHTHTSGSVTDFTEAAQDATGAMVDASLVYVDGTPLLTRAALTGAVTAAQGSNATLLGSFTKANLTTAVSDGDPLYVGDVTTNATHTGEVTGSGALTVQPSAITNRSVVAVDRAADHILFHDASGAVLAKALGTTMDLVNDTTPELGGTLDGLLQPVINLQYVDIDGLATYGSGGVEAQKPAFVGMIANHTWNYQISIPVFGNALQLPPAVVFTGTQTIQKSMSILGGGFLFHSWPTFKNPNGTAVDFSVMYTLVNQATYQADNAVVPLIGAGVDFLSQPTFNRINGGTISGAGASIQTMLSAPAIDTGATIGSRYGTQVQDTTGAGTLTNQAGIMIADLLKGTNDTEIIAGQLTVPTGDFNFYQGNEKRSRFNGAREYKVSTGTADRTLDNTHHVIQLTGATNRNFNFPAANTCKGREYVLKKSGIGNITPVMAGGSGDTIDGVAPVALTVLNSSRAYVSDGGTNWLITGSYL